MLWPWDGVGDGSDLCRDLLLACYCRSLLLAYLLRLPEVLSRDIEIKLTLVQSSCS